MDKKSAPDHAFQESVDAIAKELQLPGLIARILVGRDINTADKARIFLDPKLEDLSDPFLLPDAVKGAERIVSAIVKREKICLYGDYDADGVTSLALMLNFLRHFGLEPIVYIPTRQEGYGLHVNAIKKVSERNPTLLISLDCGSSNVSEVQYANDNGIQTIIIDHHELGEGMPSAYALINPKRKDSHFPTRDLAACGVTFFVMLAVRRVLHNEGLLQKPINLKRELDIVSIGTVGDMVSLTGDNRIMVKHGMDVMSRHSRPWLTAMQKSRVLTKKVMDEFGLSFIVVPRINATGRVSDPENSLKFLLSENEAEAGYHLKTLEDANKHRRSVEERILREIVAELKNDHIDQRKSIVVFNEKWHIGVLGIVAQKLSEMFKKPSIVITKLNGIWKGSGRGSSGIDLHGTITSLSPLLLKYGGHRYACGLSLQEENLTRFADAFEELVGNSIAHDSEEMFCDAIAEFEDLTPEFMRYLGKLSPFGVGNPRPIISLSPTAIEPLKYGRVRIKDGNNRNWYGYVRADLHIPSCDNPFCAAAPMLKEEMGEQFIHLNIKDISKKPFPTKN
ncbi:MAG TPA: single-stranded-DNA-specific exonuclease RecJ [Syntrophorhabdaceae bacterium]|nr:single-stranded-DNA-specific exonuclease RecJ [Syntrophorhabdaceae bacterium]